LWCRRVSPLAGGLPIKIARKCVTLMVAQPVEVHRMRRASIALHVVALSIISSAAVSCSSGGKNSDGAMPGTGGSGGAGGGQETILFKMDSVEGVSYNPPQITTFTLATASYITRVWTYHYGATIGAKSPTVAFKDTSSGTIFGPWAQVGYKSFAGTLGATRSDPANIPGPPDNYWMAYPAATVPAGTYQVIDSDPATWAYTDDLGDRGVTWVYGFGSGTGDAGAGGDGSVAATVYTATASPSSQPTTVTVGPVVSITVPGGLLAQTATFSVSTVPQLPSDIPSPNQLLGAWNLTCDAGSTFTQELTLEFSYDPSLLDPGLAEGKGIFMAYWDETAVGWVSVPVQVDTVNKRLVVRTLHLSTWAYWTLRGFSNLATSAGHFDVYYDPTAASPLTDATMTMPDFAAHVGEILEQAYTAYYAAGFTMPSSWFAFTIKVIIIDDMRWVWNTWNLSKYVGSYENPDDSTPMYSSLSGNIFLKRSMLVTDEVIHTDGAHELFHAVQNQYVTVYNMARNLWWYEGTPDYAAYYVAWQGSIPLNKFISPTPVDYFVDPLTENQDTHAYQMAVFLDYLHSHQNIEFKSLWDAVEQTTDPLTGFSAYVTKNGTTTFDSVWSNFVDWMYFTPPFTFSPASLAVQVSDAKPSATQSFALAGGYTASSLLVRVKLSASETALSPVVSTTADIPASVSIELWYAPGGVMATASLKQVLVGSTRSSTPIALGANDQLYLLVLNTGTTAANLALTVSVPVQAPPTCQFVSGTPTSINLALATTKCLNSNALSFCFTPQANGTILKSSDAGCDQFVDSYQVSGTYSCNALNLTYTFNDSEASDYPGCSLTSTVTRNIVYSGTVPITWNPTSSAYTIGTNSGTYNSSYSSSTCSVTFPTCSASDLQVTSAN
jgi:hypothetical protein